MEIERGSMREEALDRTLWRTRFVRGYGRVVRQTTNRFNFHEIHISKLYVNVKTILNSFSFLSYKANLFLLIQRFMNIHVKHVYTLKNRSSVHVNNVTRTRVVARFRL